MGMRETGNLEIIRAIVSMAAGLSMDVTAEGIETSDQLNRLQELECGFGQGFYFNRPLTASDAGALLRTRSWRAAGPVAAAAAAAVKQD